jgi:RNA polymerase sigma factor (sigma-70 family)
VELVAQALAGDRDAWAGIWDLHGPRLHAYARNLLGDEHDANDAVADTFVSAAEHLAELRDPEALRPWLYSICRRHVQRRWAARDRVRPVEDDYLAGVVDGRQHVVNSTGLDAAAASGLLWEAAEGLGPADRELLALVLNADLDSGDVAAITGEAPSAVYVKVSRLKDSLGRAAGALLVARHHRADCAELDALLSSWDGTYSALWRKRIARHVDDCTVCGGSRKTAAAALFALAVCAPLPVLPALKERCLSRTASPDMVAVSFAAGWPESRPWTPARRRRRRAGLFVAAAALLLLGGAGVTALANNGEQLDLSHHVVATETSPGASSPVDAAPLPPPSADTASVGVVTPTPTPSPMPTPTPSPTPTPTPTRTVMPSASAVASPAPAPVPMATLSAVRTQPAITQTAAPRPTATLPVATPRPTRTLPRPTPPPPPPPSPTRSVPAPLPPAPTVRLALRDAAISTACGTPSTTQAVVDATGQSAQTVVRWGGTAPGSRAFPGSGSATIGPYSSVTGADGSDTVTVTATVTDALGRAVQATRTLTVNLAPC